MKELKELYQRRDLLEIEIKSLLKKTNQLEIDVKNINDRIDLIEEKDNSTNSLFWDFVEKADWPKDHNYQRISELVKEYSKEDQMSIFRKYSRLMSKLNEKFGEKDFEDAYVSDDSWNDLRAEIIGRGENFYKNIKFEKIVKMAKSNDFVESFGYSFLDI